MTDTAEKSDNCPCPTEKPKAGFRLRDIFKKSTACCCGTAAGGFLVGHAGCIATPLVIAFSGVALSGAGAGLLAIGIGAGVTTGALGLWHLLRGKKADAVEKRNVIRGALIGFGLSAVFNMVYHRNHHANHQPADPRLGREVIMCGVPSRAPADTIKQKTVRIDTAAVAR